MDYMNFQIALQDYYFGFEESSPKIDYNVIFKNLAEERKHDFLKAFVFAPEPDDFLMDDFRLVNTYKWLTGMRNAPNIDVVFGRHIARPINKDIPMKIDDPSTYYKVEKGTDINLAIHALVKAQYNAYDVAFIMSADTDYISVYRQLKNMGKIVIAVAVKEQRLGKVIPEVDDFIILDRHFFNGCLRPEKLFV